MPLLSFLSPYRDSHTHPELALKKVEGVKTVEATYEPNEAIVTFDDTKTNTKELMAATENACYSSNVKSSD